MVNARKEFFDGYHSLAKMLGRRAQYCIGAASVVQTIPLASLLKLNLKSMHHYTKSPTSIGRSLKELKSVGPFVRPENIAI